MDRKNQEKWKEIKGYGIEMLRTAIDSLVVQMKDTFDNPDDYTEEQIQELYNELLKWDAFLDEEREKIKEIMKKTS